MIFVPLSRLATILLRLPARECNENDLSNESRAKGRRSVRGPFARREALRDLSRSGEFGDSDQMLPKPMMSAFEVANPKGPM